MSSRDEKKAVAMKRMLKKQVRSQLKRKRPNADDSDDDNDDAHVGMPTPKEFNDRDNKRTAPSSKSGAKKRKASDAPKKFNLSADATTVSVSDHALVLCVWKGAVGEDPPSEDLKASRKSIGVNVRGNLSLCPAPLTSIQSSDLPSEILMSIKSLGFTALSPVQQQSIPALLSGANVLSISPTGSGKTYAYGLPMLTHILSHVKSISNKGNIPSPIALVIVPTRELSIQVAAAFKVFMKLFQIQSVALYGGQDKETQLEHITGTLHAAVCTPGRLIDLVKGKNVSLFNVSYLVLDEADRMLNMGFFDQLEFISRHIRSDRQSVLFSATFPGKLRDAGAVWVRNAVVIRCNSIELSSLEGESVLKDTTVNSKMSRSDATMNDIITEEEQGIEASLISNNEETVESRSSYTLPSSITQHVHVCATHKKPRLLLKCISRIREAEKLANVRQPGAMLIFCTKIKTIKFVEDFLKRQNVVAKVLHGQLPQAQREAILNDFKSGKSSMVCATDVAARGIHIKRLKYVINYDFPVNLEQYCHRVGRTGRQGETGTAFSFFTRNLAPLAADLITLLKCSMQEVEPNLLALRDEYLLGNFDEKEEEEDDEDKANDV